MKKAEPDNSTVDDFEAHLLAKGLAAHTVHGYLLGVGSFLASVGNQPIERITEEQTREYFDSIKNPNNRRQHAMIISQFLTFAMAKLPVVVNKAGGEIPPPGRALTKKELALREKWTLEKLQAEAERKDKIIARIGRQVVAHYVHFEKQLKGSPEDLDEVSRLADECRELIQSNLALFMALQAEGHNVSTKFSERILP